MNKHDDLRAWYRLLQSFSKVRNKTIGQSL